MKTLILTTCLLASIPLLLWYFITAPSFVTPPTIYTPQANPEKLALYVKTLTEDLSPRSDDIDKLNISADYLFTEFSRHTSHVEFQEYSVWGINYKNVIAYIGENDCGKTYIIGAHYDSFAGLPGADDNASGVAGLLELARLFSAIKPPCKIQIVAYSLEEPPYFRSTDMGSYHHAKKLKEENLSVAMMLSLEMIGYYSDKKDSQQFPLSLLKYIYPSEGNFIALVSNFSNFSLTKKLKKGMIKASPLPVYSINAPAIIPGIDYSDHRNYWHFGFPAAMITDTSFYRNKNYHTEADTWDTLDYAKMAMVVDGVYSIVINTMINN